MNHNGNIITLLITSGILPESLTTGEAYKLLKDTTPITIKQLQTDPDIKQFLQAKRYGKGRNYKYSSKKVLELIQRNLS